MPLLLHEIQWGDPIFPPVADAAWEAELKRRGVKPGEADRRVAPIPWLREACLAMSGYRCSLLPVRLMHIGAMVTSQENSCRYCYGANRAMMKVQGYPESMIGRIERDAHMAELDEKERAFIAFCRNLARSKPRPAQAERKALVQMGFAPLAVNEMAFCIALGCFYNRVAVLMVTPPERALEKFANSFAGRVAGLAMRLRNTFNAGKPAVTAAAAAPAKAGGPFGAIVATLDGLPAAAVLQTALEGAFASPVLSRRVKALMFAVVARALECGRCETESGGLLAPEGFSGAEIENALSTLESKRLESRESRLLAWVRDTVHYQTGPIQAQTRALAREIGDAAALEAIGVAALANATVRLAMLLE